MEFEDEQDEEQEEEEEEITIPPSSVPPSYDSIAAGNSAPRLRKLSPSGVTRYRECLKNHAVSIGGHAVDGCGEFIPADEEGTLDALKCAACNCHRNFHRKESYSGGATTPPPPLSYRTPPPPPTGYLHVLGMGRHLQPSTSGGTHSGEMDDVSHPSSGGDGGGGSGMMAAKRRFRTKFTAAQKDKMLEFAEKLGWRIQKHDEAAVQRFCDEVQVHRKVFKVWMHNNKYTLGKTP